MQIIESKVVDSSKTGSLRNTVGVLKNSIDVVLLVIFFGFVLQNILLA